MAAGGHASVAHDLGAALRHIRVGLRGGGLIEARRHWHLVGVAQAALRTRVPRSQILAAQAGSNIRAGRKGLAWPASGHRRARGGPKDSGLVPLSGNTDSENFSEKGPFKVR